MLYYYVNFFNNNTLFISLCVLCSIPETVKGNARIRAGVIHITKYDDVIEKITFFPHRYSVFIFKKYPLSKLHTFKKYVLSKLHTFKKYVLSKLRTFKKYVLSKVRTFKSMHFLKIRTFKNTYFQKYALSKIRTFKTQFF